MVVDAPFALQTGLTDEDPNVRRAAMRRIASHGDNLPKQLVEKSLAIALADPDDNIRHLALTAMAQIGAKEVALAHLSHSLKSNSEQIRAKAAEACMGLVDRSPQALIDLLEPLLDDNARDVRASVLAPLARAYVATNSPKQLEKMMADAEQHALRRHVITAAFIVLARTQAGRTAALSSLKTITSPAGKFAAELATNLIQHSADGVTFLKMLVP